MNFVYDRSLYGWKKHIIHIEFFAVYNYTCLQELFTNYIYIPGRVAISSFFIFDQLIKRENVQRKKFSRWIKYEKNKKRF